MTASPHRPISSLATDGSTTGILILYSANGAPLRVSSLADATSNRSAIALGQQGVAASYRIIEAGEDIADVLVGLMGDVFRLPLGGSSGNGATATPAKRGRKPGSKKGKPAGAKKKRGRPAKAAAVDGMVVSPEAPAKKRKAGRPRKNASVDSTMPVKRKAGRPRKSVTPDGIVPTKKGPGRPKKVVDGGSPAPAKKKAGRPRKNPVVDTTAPKRGPGRPRKNPA